MCHSILSNASFYAALLDLDNELALTARERGCPKCQGALHTADYPRKPRAPIELPPEQRYRKSLCCAGCRRRHTPESVRFLKSKVYLSVVIALATALTRSISPSARRKLAAETARRELRLGDSHVTQRNTEPQRFPPRQELRL